MGKKNHHIKRTVQCQEISKHRELKAPITKFVIHDPLPLDPVTVPNRW